jgi:hypothetical protein
VHIALRWGAAEVYWGLLSADYAACVPAYRCLTSAAISGLRGLEKEMEGILEASISYTVIIFSVEIAGYETINTQSLPKSTWAYLRVSTDVYKQHVEI